MLGPFIDDVASVEVVDGEPFVWELPLMLPVVGILDELVWVLLVALLSADELGNEVVGVTGTLLGVAEVVTLSADVGFCVDAEDGNPV